MYPDEYLNSDDSKSVKFYTLPFEALNNWSAHTINVYGRTFYTLEHAYHFRKFNEEHPNVADEIAHAQSPWAAKQVARKHQTKMRSDWHTIKVRVMEELLRLKSTQNEDVQTVLGNTGDREIIENSPTDYFWGCGEDGSGENTLGRLWMKIRDEKL